MKQGSWENDFSQNKTRYICEWDYIYVPENLGDLWLRMGLLADNGNSVRGVLAPLTHNLTGGYTVRTDGAKIFQPDSKKWLDLSQDNGKLFADVSHSRALMLNDNGAQFFGESFIECSALPLWLAPAGNVDAVCESCVLSQSDNSLLVTETRRGFCRQVLKAQTLPLSVGYSDMQAAIALNSQDDSTSSLQLNTFAGGSCNVQPIAWSNIYKQFLSVSHLLSFPKSDMPQKIGDPYVPLFLSQGSENISLQNETISVSKSNAVSGEMWGKSLPPRYNSFSGHFPPIDDLDYEDYDGYASLGAMESAAGVSVPMGSWQDFGVDLEPGAHIAGSAVWQILTVDFNTGRFVPLFEINAPIMAIVESSLVGKSFSGTISWTYEYWYIDFDADPPHWAIMLTLTSYAHAIRSSATRSLH